MDDLRARLETALAGTYTFERELGGGGMSRTYLVREKALDRRVVVKVLAPELLAGISVERFRREVLLAAQLQHPHVVPVLTAGDTDGLPWFTMPYVDGDSLRQRLAQGPMSISEIVGILRDVARALEYAHARGVVHRDIKPDNVLLSGRSATVTDFGIAKAINAARGDTGGHRTELTVAGTSIGTPTYMAPEQAVGDPNTDHRADLYSFGAMAYELLAGAPPFHGLSPSKLLAAHIGERAGDVRALRADCPETLATLVMQCLEKDPADRPQSASDLARVLETITSSGAAAAAPAILAGGRMRFARAIALWAGATAVVALTAWAATDVIGLPDWVFPGALGVMLAGLPVIVATWYVQKVVHRTYVATPTLTPGGTRSAVPPQGTMATMAIKASPHLSWRRTWLGGSIAVGGFAALVIGFMVMRAMGIGPFGSLRGQGKFGARETIVVADFRSPPGDSTLGATVAEALRTDLVQSSALDVLTRDETREALVRMRRGADDQLPFEVARELATREGAKAVLDGAIVRLGRSYVVTARLVSAIDGTELVPFRETADDEDELLPALGRIARAVRERAGESLRSIRASDELSAVTTASLPALRKYVEGIRAADELGDTDRGLALLQEAVELDTAFAMAWRKIGAMLGNDRRERSRQLQAIETAYRHRDRLTELERNLTEGYYFTNGPRPDWRRAVAAYEAASALPGAGTAGLNNAAVVYGYLREHTKAEALYRRAVEGGTRFSTGWTNLLTEQILNGARGANLDSTRDRFRAAFPESGDLWTADYSIAFAREQWDAADSAARAAFAGTTVSRQRIRSAYLAASVAELRGRPREALQWDARSRQAILAQTPTDVERLGAALDSAMTFATVLDRPEEARAIAARAVRRYPPSGMNAADRPWIPLLQVAALARDPELAATAGRGARADQRTIGPDSTGVLAYFASLEAFANQDWRGAVAGMQEADRRLMVWEREAAIVLGQAHDYAGAADSSIAQLERFVTGFDGDPSLDRRMRAPSYKRLGELYEAKGDRARAIANYERFVDLWKNAEPELQPKVREVQARLDRLRPAM